MGVHLDEEAGIVLPGGASRQWEKVPGFSAGCLALVLF
jgi:hypothetical protein